MADRGVAVYQLFEDGTALVICQECAWDCQRCTGCVRSGEGLIAQNPAGAEPGELVLVRTNRNKMLLAALMLYLIPVLCFFGGYWFGIQLYSTGKITGCMAFLAGLGASLIYDRCVASRRGSGYTIVKYPQNINKGDNEFD